MIVYYTSQAKNGCPFTLAGIMITKFFWLRFASFFPEFTIKESQLKEYAMSIAHNHAPSACQALD